MDASNSIIEHQPGLFSLEELTLLNVDKPEVARRYTGEALLAHRTKRDAVCRALAEGHGLLKIGRAFGISHHSVAALRDSRPDLVDIAKHQLSQTLGRVLRVCLEQFEDGVVSGKVHPGQLPIAFGILSDKKALLDGDPTARVESVVRHEVSLELVASYLAKKGISMPVIDVESTVSPSNSKQTGHSDRPSGTAGCTAPAVASITDPAAAASAASGLAGADDRGGGGEATVAGGLPIHSSTEIFTPKES